MYDDRNKKITAILQAGFKNNIGMFVKNIAGLKGRDVLLWVELD